MDVAVLLTVQRLMCQHIVCRYLVLEHVSGGELFDYLVRKGRLSEREVCDLQEVDFVWPY